MATIDFATEGAAGLHPSRGANVKVPYLVEVEFTIADAIEDKGSALAQADVIQVIPVPANSLILDAGLVCKTAMTGTSTDLTWDFGITGVVVDQFVNGWDVDAATAGDQAAPRGVGLGRLVEAADTLDILFATQTGTILTGTFRAWALIVDLSDAQAPGLAALAS
jgi:hypothetical protein